MTREQLQLIQREVAHCLASYGEEPQELVIKLEELVAEWYKKGLNSILTKNHDA